MANISSNVIYVEPNYTCSYKNGIESYNADGEREVVDGISVFEQAPPLEDYCMAFQLSVVMPTKTTHGGGVTKENDIITITCTDRGNQRAMSILQGTVLPGTKTPFLNFLTTAALETSIDDVKKYHPNEMFGVKSIDISYQAYMTPEITIKFTDIRAASLFGQEELAHEHNGLMNNDTEASFFHCFFMMPYPLFGLVVKGYYGEAVSYELMVQNFKFNLDPTTGNYEAEARFLGYTWSILSDVTFNALVAAPYCAYGGQEYWNQHKTMSESEGGFVVDGDMPMPTIPEIVNAFKNLKEGQTKMSKFDPDVSKNEQVKNEQTELIAIHDRMVAVIEEFGNNIGSTRAIVVPINGSWKNGCVIYGNRGGSSKKTTQGDWPRMEALIEGLKEIKTLCISANYALFPTTIQLDKDVKDILNNAIDGGSTTTTIGKLETPSKYLLTKLKTEALSNITTETWGAFQKKFVDDKIWGEMATDEWIYAYVINLTEWLPNLSNKIAENQKTLADTEQEIKRKMQENVAKVIGMSPTVYNITKVMFAHLETLIHCVTLCEDSISSERTYQSTELDNTDMVKGCDNSPTNSNRESSGSTMKLCPFPEVKITSERDGRKIVEDGWLGELSNSDELEEVKLVEEMVKAIDKLKETVENTGSTYTNIDGSVGQLSVSVPVVPSDLFITSPIFNLAAVDKKNISEILGVIGLRATYVLNSVSDIANEAKTAGKLDAINFYEQDKSGLSNIWLDVITNNTKDEFVEIATKILINKEIPSDVFTYTNGGNVPWHGSGKNQLIKLKDNWIIANLPLVRKDSTTLTGNNYYIQNLSFELKGLGKTETTTNETENLASLSYSWENDVKGNALFRFIGNPIEYSGVIEIFDRDDVKDVSGSGDIKDNFEQLNKYATLDRDNYGEMFGTDNILSSDFDHHAFIRTYKSANKDKTLNDYHPYTTKYTKGKFDTSKLSYTFSKDMSEMENSTVYGTAFCTKGTISNYDLTELRVYDGNDGIIKLKRDKDDNIGAYLNGEENISEFTIPMIMGIDANGNQVNTLSVFTQEPYMNATSNYEKAAMFLMAITNGKYGIDISDCIDRFKENSNNGKELFKFLPYTFILLLGAYIFWKRDFGTDGQSKTYFRNEISDQSNKRKWKSYVSDAFDNFTKNIHQGDLGKKLNFISSVKTELQNFLCNEFEVWVGEDTSKQSNIDLTTNLKFKEIQSGLELPIDNDNKNKIANILAGKQGLGSTSLEKYLMKLGLGQDFFNNYISVKGDTEYTFLLFTREDSDLIQKLTAMYIQPVLFVEFNESLGIGDMDENRVKPGVSHLKSYLGGFWEEYRKLQHIEDPSNGNSIPREDADVSKHIKISLYKYLKILYDRWLATKYYEHQNEEHWGIKTFFNDHFHFIDQYYMDTRDIYFDMEGLVNSFEASFTQETFSFLSYLTDALTRAQFAFFPVQNFLDYYDEKSADRMKNLFKPIPYNEAFRDAPSPHQIYPDFVILYKSEASSEPATDDGCGDSFMLNYDEQFLPYPIRENPGIKKSRIPAFGVSYGKQYQSYFQNIEVSTESPTPTEQSLKAQYMCAGANSRTGGENGEQVQVLGQDLYTIYSKQSYSCTVQMMGDMWIQPTMYFVLTNVPTFRGSYIIQKVNHQISPGKMTTTFMGTRMANTTTPHVYNWYIGKTSQNGASEGSTEDDASKRANIGNDCPYKIFTPGIASGTGAWTEEMLNMTWDEFCAAGYDSQPEKGKNMKKLYQDTNGEKLIDIFTYILAREQGGLNNMATKCLAAAMFNAYASKGGGHYANSLYNIAFGWGGYPTGHNYAAISDRHKAKWETLSETVREIFTNTPAVLVGQTIDQGDKYAAYTQDKKVDGSWTVVGYTPPQALVDRLNSLGTTFTMDIDTIRHIVHQGRAGDCDYKDWSKSFCVKNDGFKDDSPYRSVLFSTALGVTPLWEATPPKPQGEPSLKKDLEDLVASIQRTCIYSDGISISNIHASYEEAADYAIAKISIIQSMDKASIDNATLFDIAANGYPAYHHETYWVVANENSGKEFPIYVVLKKYNDTASSAKRALCYKSDSGYVAIADNITNADTTSSGILNEYFYRSIAKAYLATDGSDEKENNKLNNLKDSIMSEVPNFKISTGDSMKTEGEKVFTVLSKFAPAPCGGNTASSWNGPVIEGLPQNERYSWYLAKNELPPNE